MAQVTLYLDNETAQRMKKAAQREGVSQSRWLAGLVRDATARDWPAEVRELAGAWADFPELDELRRGTGRDARREKL